MPETTIQLDETTKAFYKGVAAANKAHARLAELPEAPAFEALVRYFWLSVGTELGQSGIDGENEAAVTAFVQGATTRQPEPGNALTLVLGSSVLEGHAGVPAGAVEVEFDEQGAREAIAGHLRSTARLIERGSDGDSLRNNDGDKVGQFGLDLWS